MVDRLEYLEAAENIIIHVRSNDAAESDHIELMQRPSTQGQQRAVDLPEKTAECAGFQTPHLNPDAPEFIPGVPNFWTQPQEINDLYSAWRSGAFDWQGGELAAHFQVWFLCPERGVRRCLHPRRVTLHENVDEWRERLLRTWSDQIFPGIPFDIHLVRPNPPHMESDIAGHIILTRLFANQASGVLLTIQDDAVNNRLPHRIAITVPNPCHLVHIREATGYEHEAATFWLSSGNLNYEAQQAIPTRHGSGFHLVVTHAFLTHGGTSSASTHAQADGGLNLLQRRMHLHRTDSERLWCGGSSPWAGVQSNP